MDALSKKKSDGKGGFTRKASLRPVKKIEDLTLEEMRTMLGSIKIELQQRSMIFEEEILDGIEQTFALFGVRF